MRKWGFKTGLNIFSLRFIWGWSVAVLFGSAGFFAARLFDFSQLPAVGWTLGSFGFVGGGLLARQLRSAGARVRPSQYLLLALTWALGCMGGSFPLFFTVGTRLEMAVRTFYSFAIFGAGGGIITTLVLRSLFPQHAKNDWMPSAIAWAFSWGLAAVTVDAAGEWLQSTGPAWAAWPLAIAIMTVVLGLGSGCSILRFFQSDQGAWPHRGLMIRDGAFSAAGQTAHSPWILIILCIPFYLNDFSNIFVKDWRWWLVIDYAGVKLFPFLVIRHLIGNRTLTRVDFAGSGRQSAVSFLSVVVITALAALFIEQNGSLLLTKLFRDAPVGSIPDIPYPFWKWIDLSAGLLMAGILEEVVFRGYFFTFLRQYSFRPSVCILFSAVAFGMIHWSGGVHQIILTSAVGAVFMLVYLRTASLPAVIMSHFIVNFVDLAGIIPSSLFRFFSFPPLH